MFEKIKKLFSNKTPEPVAPQGKVKTIVIPTTIQKTAWRNNMWVMTPEGIGIIFKLAEPCTVHLVDSETGLTLREVWINSEDMRQAKYLEIPECRRCDEERAKFLGYE